MRPSILIGALTTLLATFIVLAWLRWDALDARQQELDRLAWGLKQPGRAGLLSRAEQLFLDGRFLEVAAVQPPPPDYLVEAALRCQLFNLPWPRQVVRAHVIHSDLEKGRWYAVRVSESGYVGSSELPLVEQFSFEKGKWKSLSSRRWKAVQVVKTIHLERRDPKQSQAYLAGSNEQGQSQVEVVQVDAGYTIWRQSGKQAAVLESDHIRLDDKRYKLVDKEWSALPLK